MDRSAASVSAPRPRLDAQHLRIRRVEPSDHEALMRIFESPGTYAGTLQLPFPSAEAWRERLAKVDPNGVMLAAEARDPSRPDDAFEIVGNLGLHPLGPSLRRRHVLTIGIAIRDDWWGRGIGSALMVAALDRADNWMNVLRIELEVFVDNEPAIALYRRFGFEIEGRHRAHAFRDGVFVDAYSMARLHPRQPMLPRVATPVSHEGAR